MLAPRKHTSQIITYSTGGVPRAFRLHSYTNSTCISIKKNLHNFAYLAFFCQHYFSKVESERQGSAAKWENGWPIKWARKLEASEAASGGPRIWRLCIQKFKTQKQNGYFIPIVHTYTFDYTFKYYGVAKLIGIQWIHMHTKWARPWKQQGRIKAERLKVWRSKGSLFNWLWVLELSWLFNEPVIKWLVFFVLGLFMKWHDKWCWDVICIWIRWFLDKWWRAVLSILWSDVLFWMNILFWSDLKPNQIIRLNK